MRLNRETLYLSLWVLTPLVSDLGSKTPFPNQIYVLYELLEVFLCALFFRNFMTVVRVQVKWLCVLLLYAVTFIAVSYYGVDFATSVEYGVFYLPMIVTLEFFVAFSVGYLFEEQITFRFLVGAAFVQMAYTFLGIQLWPYAQRYITGLSLPMAIPLFIYSGRGLWALVCLMVLFLSLKKTIVAVGILSIGLAYLLKGYAQPGVSFFSRYIKRRRFITAMLTVPVILLTIGVIFVRYAPQLSGTLARFSEPEDTARSSIALYSILLLAEHFPRGIGWFGFLSQSIGVISYDATDARGDVHLGANLHSTYMTWALEGGLPIVLIMVYLFWKLIRVTWFFLRNDPTRVLGVTLLIWLLVGMVYGTFNQWHSSGTLWALFGFAFGCSERYKARQHLA